jgi:hypothetical protein
MPSAGIIAIAALGTMLIVGVSKTERWFKSVIHQTGCVIAHGHKCVNQDATPKN